MPNWCSNQLLIFGEKATRDQLLSYFVTPSDIPGGVPTIKFSLRRINPIPLELEEPDSYPQPETAEEIVQNIQRLIKDYGASNWYDWCCLHWGTKWDVDGEYYEHNEAYTRFCFSSAWSPPTQAIITLSTLYRDLTFVLDYSEPGVRCDGTEWFYRGIAITEETSDYEWPSGLITMAEEDAEILADLEDENNEDEEGDDA